MPEIRALSRRAVLAASSAALMSFGLAACGGGSSSSQSSTSTTSTSTAQQGGKAAVTSGPVRGTLRAQNHAPKVNKPWVYSVHVTDAGGHPLAGTVEIEFVYGDQVVGRDTPPTHPVTAGRWHDRLTFPAPAVGMPLTFRAVVHTRAGTITLDWPVKVAA